MESRTLFMRLCSLVVCVLVVFPTPRAQAQLFDNLEAFGNRLDVGDPDVSSRWEWFRIEPLT